MSRAQSSTRTATLGAAEPASADFARALSARAPAEAAPRGRAATPRRRGALRPWRRWLDVDRPSLTRADRELEWVPSDDQLALALWRLPPRRGDRVQAPEPIFLLHGLGSNRFGFDCPGRSLAYWLSGAGYDVYLPELRGHGASTPPTRGWNLDDYLRRDVPALLSAATRRSGFEQVHWIGHSMGGLLWFLLATHGDSSQVASAIALGSALDYRPGASGFRGLLGLRSLASRVSMLPYGQLMHCLAPTFGRRLSWLDAFNVWPSNIEPALNRRLHANAFESIPVSLLLQLASAFDDSGLTSADGSVQYLRAQHPLTTPTLLVSGSVDQQATRQAVMASAALLGPRAEQAEFGRGTGCRDDYGHWDLLLGRRAPREIWPRLLSWLGRHPLA